MLGVSLGGWLGVAGGASALAVGKWYLNGGVNPYHPSLEGRVVVVTGAYAGIGFETTRELVRLGAHVVLGCRDEKRAGVALGRIKAEGYSGTCEFIRLDLSSRASIEEFAKTFKSRHGKLHILINNAGVMACPQWNTSEGFEMQFGTNHLGHFLLTYLLIDPLQAAAPSRVVVVSSRSHEKATINFTDVHFKRRSYSAAEAYGQSKLANILFTKEFSNKFAEKGITAYCLHPGVVRTELSRHFNHTVLCLLSPLIWYFTKSPQRGAQTSLYCALAPNIEKHSGKYFTDCALATPAPEAEDDGLAKKLWYYSEEQWGITFG
eukprot:TRINITY_DN13116_c0_g1_i1.p1 TRINITY_DN13116_c0_g1~~TRINITY_DN13116_c0_g1_i1.p1  ORF type:complete len:320 (-),score=49.34 TRINITY_DN13116_c0_g1_i1:82-1041(-)